MVPVEIRVCNVGSLSMHDLLSVKCIVDGHTGDTLFRSDIPQECLNFFDGLDSYRSVYSVYDVHPSLRLQYHTRHDRGELWLVPHGL